MLICGMNWIAGKRKYCEWGRDTPLPSIACIKWEGGKGGGRGERKVII